MTMSFNIVALDIGGANLKAADGLGWALSRSFPLWRAPEDLSAQLTAMLLAAPGDGPVMATMTGELCDCFATKQEGAHRIAASLLSAADGRPVFFYGVGGRFVRPTAGLDAFAAEHWPILAASNWDASARYAGHYARQGPSLFLDIGSTTTDIIPLWNGKPRAKGANDPERLAAGELVYTGVERTPICALAPTLPWRGQDCPVAAELFATSGDAWRVLGELPEEPEERATADGRPATIECSRDRLARMVCGDRTLVRDDEITQGAQRTAAAQRSLVERACCRVISGLGQEPTSWLLAGQGEFLARRVAESLRGASARVVSLREMLGPDVSRVFPAHAVAVLARQAGALECGT